MSTLVYLCHFGDDTHGDFLVTAVTALQTVGQYQGDILIFTDNHERTAQLVKQLPNPEKVGLLNHEPTRGLFNRYQAAYDLASLYGSLYTDFIYLDNDILCLGDITSFVKTIEESTQELHVYTQAYYPKFNGGLKVRQDPLTIAYGLGYVGSLLLIYPSIFAFKPTDKTIELFKSLTEMRHRLPEYRYKHGFDVSYFSHAAYQLKGALNRTHITESVHQLTPQDVASGAEVEVGIIHLRNFPTNEQKLFAMTRLLKKQGLPYRDKLTVLNNLGKGESV